MDLDNRKQRRDDFSDDDDFQSLTPIKAALLTNIETALINSIIQDDKTLFLTRSRQLIRDSDDDPSNRRSVALKLLLLSCYFDAVECSTSLLSGDVDKNCSPVVNEVDSATKMTALQAAAEGQAPRCVELLLKRRARTDMRSKDGRSLLPLETALNSSRVDVIWNPDDYSVEELVILLSEKDLRAVALLGEKTKTVAQVAYSIAMRGKIVALAALLMVAAPKINKSVIVLRDADSGTKEKATLYQCLIREALSLGRRQASPFRTAKKNCTPTKVESDNKRKLLLCEIELLQMFGAVSENGCGDKKLTSSLIRAIKARDEAVIDLLLRTNIDVNDADAEGNSALHWSLRLSWSSSSQQIKIIWLLLKHGARVNQKNKLDLTPVHIAATRGDTQALQVLLLEDPDCVNCKSIMNETPLFLAVKNDHIDCAELLLRWGANYEVLNLRRERLLDLAKSQDMRFMLNPTSVTKRNRISLVQKKSTPRFQGDEVIFDTCEALLSMTDEGSCTERISSRVKTETCKYFESPGGCNRGSKCLYAHGEEELRPEKKEKHLSHSFAAQRLKRKIFIGGLHPLTDCDSLTRCFEDQFGPVEHARVIRLRTGNEKCRRFGFVTFREEKSVSKAVQAHYVTIKGKQVEIKSAVERWDESLKLSSQYQPKLEESSEKTAKEMPRRKTTLEEAKTDKLSWMDKLVHGQPKKGTPTWLRTFKKWLPSLLKEASKNPKDGEYPLSSLKADFRDAFGLQLDHASLGYQKLSDFLKSFPDLCSMKSVPSGESQSPNHTVLTLPNTDKISLQPSPMHCPPSTAALPDENTDNDSNDSRYRQDLPSDSCGNVSVSRGKVNPCQNIPREKSAPKATLPVVDSDFLKFFKSEVCLTQSKVYNERKAENVNEEREATQRLNDREVRHTGRHLVLEALLRQKNNTSIFFLREFDFYHNYKASIKQGRCFWCNQPKLLWANFPCQHILWCGDCRKEAARAAGDFDHKCVICDVKVQKYILTPMDRYPKSFHGKILKNEEFPPFPPSITNVSMNLSFTR